MIRRLALASFAVVCAMCFASIAPSVSSAQGFHAVHSSDGLDLWAVGDAGVIYRSVNSGADMFSITVGSAPLRSVATQGLIALVTSDAGTVWRSANGGGAWSSETLSGTPDLYAVAFPEPTIAYVGGAGGAIWKSADAGLSWTQQFSLTAATIRAIHFSDASNGWAVGDFGNVRHTTDGGASWLPVAVPTTNRLRAVDASGNTIWIVGERGTCMRSTDGGANWEHVNLKLDARSDVRAVRVVSPETIWVAGGGGFVRRSDDGGATWTFMQHRMHGRLTGLSVVGNRAQFCSSQHRTVFHTTNGGATWAMPTLASMSQTFVNRFVHAGNVYGSTIVQSPADEATFYAAINNFVYRTRDEGESWQQIGTFPVGINKCNAFLISPKDTNLWIAAVGGSPPIANRLLRTVNAGVSWDTVLTKPFGVYGIPLEMHPDRPDTLYFGGDNSVLWRSTDFGATWESWMTDSIFRSPCDIVCVPDSSNIILVGDGITGSPNPPGQYYKSVDGGLTFELMHSRVGISSASEIPGMACSRLRNNAVIGTNWSAGGVQRSLDYGTTWPTVSNAAPAWGVDIARDDPNFMIFGLYNGSGMLLSYDGGATWISFGVAGIGANYSFLARDRGVVIAEQSGGFWKLRHTYTFTPSSTQSINLNSPNGSESWAGGSVHDITWSLLNVAVVRIEYQKTDGDPWQLVADVPGSTDSYAWTVPSDVTFDAKIRVRDAWDLAPVDETDGVFTIAVPRLQPNPTELDYGARPKGSVTTLVLTLENSGSATIFVTDVTTSNPAFSEGRTTMTLMPGATDTIGVTFRPVAGVAYNATLDFVSNVSPPLSVPLTGGGIASQLTALPNPLELGAINPGATAKDTIHIENLGNGTLTIYDITSNHPEFYPSRTAFSIPPGGSDTLRVFYHPLSAGRDTATFSIAASDTAIPHELSVRGEARDNVAVSAAPPTAFALGQNQPNPFGRATQIRYALPQAADVRLEVFNLMGQRVATLVREFQSPGWYSVPFGRGAATANGARLDALPTGVYFYRLNAGPYSSTRKMLYVR